MKRFTLSFAALPFFLMGCAASGQSEPAKAPVAPVAPPETQGMANAQPEPDPADDSPGGRLVVARDVVQACPNLRVMQTQSQGGAPEGFWLMVLDGVSECMNDGALGVRHIAVVGEPGRRDVVRLVLAAKGAPMDRVEIGSLRPARICDVTGCRPEPALVQIKLAE